MGVLLFVSRRELAEKKKSRWHVRYLMKAEDWRLNAITTCVKAGIMFKFQINPYEVIDFNKDNLFLVREELLRRSVNRRA